MQLYLVESLYRQFHEDLENGAFADENGVIDWEAVNQAYDDITGTVDDKLEACACFAQELKAEIDSMADAEKRIAERRKAKENELENYKRYIAGCMEGLQYNKLERPQVRISLRKSEAVAIDDFAALPEEFTKTKTEVKADKDAIKKAFKAGVMVPGAHIEHNKSVVIK